MENKIRLLIVDDEVDFLNTITKRMQMRGFEVTAASSGQDAIDAVNKLKFDIALLDLKMPGLDGFEVLRILKREHKYIEVIILTAHGSVDAAFDTSKLGAYGFLTKPYDFEQLITTIKNAYEERLKKKFADEPEVLKRLLNKTKNIPIGAESSLDILEELRKFDDEIK